MPQKRRKPVTAAHRSIQIIPKSCAPKNPKP